MFQQPLHKRVISRVVFYGGVFLFLWLLDHTKAEEVTPVSSQTTLVQSR